MTDLPERLDLTSQDPLIERVNVLRAIFPDVFRENKVDVDALRRSLGDWVDPGPERFGLTWPGKADCMRVIQEPSIGTLVPVRDESVDFDDTKNMIIEGDNLEVLKLLQKSCYAKVKLIYIDPPYNTGNEFIYPDNFKEGLADYLRFSGQVDAEGFKVAANAETDGRYHSKWLSMMYPRLFLARNLLKEDGIIFVSIADQEVHNLRELMNEIFGEENFLASIVWENIHTRKNTAQYFSENHDYIVAYARNKGRVELKLLPRTEEVDSGYTNRDDDPRGPWGDGPVQARNYYSKGTYPITCPGGRVIEGPPTGNYWRVSKAEFDALDADRRIWWGAGGNNVPRIKRFLSEVQAGMVPQTIWSHEEVGHTQEAKAELLSHVTFASSDSVFETPKPTRLVQRMIHLAEGPSVDHDALILDFFAGSGSTGEAVVKANRADGGRRRYILVQLPEPTGYADYRSVADITKARMRSVAKKANADIHLGNTSDVGFRSYRLQPSNFRIWDSETKEAPELTTQLGLLIDHIAEGRTQESILTELLLKAGYPPTASVEQLLLADTHVYSVEGAALLVCLSDALDIDVFEAMVELEPAMILVLDAGFGGSDELKVNALQTVRARNQRTGSDIVLRVV